MLTNNILYLLYPMLSDEMQQVLNEYNKGLELYKKMEFSKALSFFEKGSAIKPDDGPCKLYVDRCKMFIKEPPPADWDGVFTMTTK